MSILDVFIYSLSARSDLELEHFLFVTSLYHQNKTNSLALSPRANYID
jgi:hypothetical protein